MKPSIHCLTRHTLSGHGLGSATALQLTGLVIAGAIALSMVWLILVPSSTTTTTPSAKATHSLPDTPASTISAHLATRGEAALGSGQVQAGEPGRGIAPTLANGDFHRGAFNSFSPWTQADQLMDRLADIRQAYDTAPQEKDKEIRQILSQLRALGQGAIPAMRRFLATGDDLAYGLVTANERQIDSRSLRLAMLEMMGAMDSIEADGVLGAELQRTRRPEEIQAITRLLEEKYPGEYSALAVNQARKMLQRISAGEVDDLDAAPLYQVLAENGGEGAVAELTQLEGPWPLYRAVALTQVPEGSGLPELLNIWQQTGDPTSKQIASQLLAQSAGRDTQAAQAFVEGLMAGKSEVPDYLWSKLGLALAGQYDLQLLKPDVGELPPEVERSPYRTIQVGGPEGTTTIYITEVKNMSQEEKLARLDVVEQLLGEDLSPTARRALEQAKKILEK